MLPIKQRVIYKLALYVRRALRSELPSYLAELLVPLTNTEHRAGLRSVTRGDLVQPERGLEIGQRSLRCSGPRIWNSLPTNVRDLQITTAEFKRRLKTHLFIVTND